MERVFYYFLDATCVKRRRNFSFESMNSSRRSTNGRLRCSQHKAIEMIENCCDVSILKYLLLCLFVSFAKCALEMYLYISICHKTTPTYLDCQTEINLSARNILFSFNRSLFLFFHLFLSFIEFSMHFFYIQDSKFNWQKVNFSFFFKWKNFNKWYYTNGFGLN